jgi:septum formation protein
VQPAEIEELTAGDPHEVVLENARRKARAVEGDLVLACDTEVIVDGAVFGKPPTAEAAAAMLEQLAGRAHEVLGGIVLRRGSELWEAVASTKVEFRTLEPGEVGEYVATGEWRGRAGGYAIQGRGAALVDGIEGDFWNVVGLPVPELVRLLKTAC